MNEPEKDYEKSSIKYTDHVDTTIRPSVERPVEPARPLEKIASMDSVYEGREIYERAKMMGKISGADMNVLSGYMLDQIQEKMGKSPEVDKAFAKIRLDMLKSPKSKKDFDVFLEFIIGLAYGSLLASQ